MAVLAAGALFMTGCADKPNRICGSGIGGTCTPQPKKKMGEEGVKAYQFGFKPIVGSRQDDSKVVVDMGKIQKIWVAPYKTKGTMVSAHDIYIWVQKPDFIVGEPLPSPKERSGVITPMDNVPFVFRKKEMDDRPDKMTNESVRQYVNSVYRAENDPSLVEKKNEEADSKFDDTILDYLNENTVKSFQKGE